VTGPELRTLGEVLVQLDAMARQQADWHEVGARDRTEILAKMEKTDKETREALMAMSVRIGVFEHLQSRAGGVFLVVSILLTGVGTILVAFWEWVVRTVVGVGP
jgi:transposase